MKCKDVIEIVASQPSFNGPNIWKSIICSDESQYVPATEQIVPVTFTLNSINLATSLKLLLSNKIAKIADYLY